MRAADLTPVKASHEEGKVHIALSQQAHNFYTSVPAISENYLLHGTTATRDKTVPGHRATNGSLHLVTQLKKILLHAGGCWMIPYKDEVLSNLREGENSGTFLHDTHSNPTRKPS